MRQDRLSSPGKANPEARLKSVLCEFYESLDTPRSLACWILFRESEFAQLVNLSINPLNYTESDTSLFGKDYAATKIVSKYPFKHKDLDPIGTAEQSFLTAEKQCLETNQRIAAYRKGQHSQFCDLIRRTASYVEQILGNVSYDGIEDLKFGPGGSIGVPRRVACTFEKLKDEISCGSFLKDSGFAEKLVPGSTFRVTACNELYLVPKNSKTHRSICKEPTLDTHIQRFFGKQIARRLLRYGIDLSTQTRNQHAAVANSRSDHCATIDLAMASDTLSKEVVSLLLPERWYSALDSVRSAGTKFLGNNLTYEKFSSMGNGYTFELETLVFFCAAKAVVHKQDWDKILVYGDDIVIPGKYFEVFNEYLAFLGFSVNKAKSHVYGLFRESCGYDAFNGTVITPFYIKEPLSNESKVLHLANSLYTYHVGAPHSRFNCDNLAPLYDRVCRWLSPKVQSIRVPESFGDSGLIGPWDASRPNVRFNRKLQSWEVHHISLVPIPIKWYGDFETAFLRAKLIRNGYNASSDIRCLREQARAYKRESVTSPSDLGEVIITSNPKAKRQYTWSVIHSWI